MKYLKKFENIKNKYYTKNKEIVNDILLYFLSGYQINEFNDMLIDIKDIDNISVSNAEVFICNENYTKKIKNLPGNYKDSIKNNNLNKFNENYHNKNKLSHYINLFTINKLKREVRKNDILSNFDISEFFKYLENEKLNIILKFEVKIKCAVGTYYYDKNIKNIIEPELNNLEYKFKNIINLKTHISTKVDITADYKYESNINFYLSM